MTAMPMREIGKTNEKTQSISSALRQRATSTGAAERFSGPGASSPASGANRTALASTTDREDSAVVARFGVKGALTIRLMGSDGATRGAKLKRRIDKRMLVSMPNVQVVVTTALNTLSRSASWPWGQRTKAVVPAGSLKLSGWTTHLFDRTEYLFRSFFEPKPPAIERRRRREDASRPPYLYRQVR